MAISHWCGHSFESSGEIGFGKTLFLRQILVIFFKKTNSIKFQNNPISLMTSPAQDCHDIK